MKKEKEREKEKEKGKVWIWEKAKEKEISLITTSVHLRQVRFPLVTEKGKVEKEAKVMVVTKMMTIMVVEERTHRILLQFRSWFTHQCHRHRWTILMTMVAVVVIVWIFHPCTFQPLVIAAMIKVMMSTTTTTIRAISIRIECTVTPVCRTPIKPVTEQQLVRVKSWGIAYYF